MCVCVWYIIYNITPSHNHPGFPQLQLEGFLCFPGLNKLGFVHGPRLHTQHLVVSQLHHNLHDHEKSRN